MMNREHSELIGIQSPKFTNGSTPSAIIMAPFDEGMTDFGVQPFTTWFRDQCTELVKYIEQALDISLKIGSKYSLIPVIE